MQFCPKCDNIMDIGKSVQRAILSVATPDTISSETPENQISKLIELYKNKEDITNFKIDLKQLTSNNEFNKLKEADRNEIIKALKSSDIDESSSAFNICKNCSYSERLVGQTLVLSRMNIESSMSGITDLSKYKYMVHDMTLPSTRDYICKNDKCASHKDYSQREAKWFRPQMNYSTYYACVSCESIWNVS